MIQSKAMNKRSKVTKRQNVRLTSEMHFFSAASYDSTLTEMGVELMEVIPLSVSRESMLLHLLSISGHAPWTGKPRPPLSVQKESSESGVVFIGAGSGDERTQFV